MTTKRIKTNKEEQIGLMKYYFDILLNQIVTVNQAITDNLVSSKTAKNMRANIIELYENIFSYVHENDLSSDVKDVYGISYIDQMIWEIKNGLI